MMACYRPDKPVPEAVQVAFACNDDNGVFEGKIRAVELSLGSSVMIEFDDGQLPRIAFYHGGNSPRVKIGRSKFTFSPGSYRRWSGNFCWDSVLMDLVVIDQRLVKHLHRIGGTLVNGPEWFWKYWEQLPSRTQHT
jgi:hypothetical protein